MNLKIAIQIFLIFKKILFNILFNRKIANIYNIDMLLYLTNI